MVTYSFERTFTQDQVQTLFASVGWVSAEYPSRLHKALMGSSAVVTAWDGPRLVVLARALDDGELVAYLHYVLVDPAYRGRGIASGLIARMKERYRNYLYLEVMPEESKNAPFYECQGFTLMQEAARCRSATSRTSARPARRLSRAA